MICGSFCESNEKKLHLQDVDWRSFGKALDVWCGKESNAEFGLDEVKELASVADRFQMTEVSSALDEAVNRNLNMDMCGEVLNWCNELGLRLSEKAARKLATERFEELTRTEGFVRMGEETLESLLENDHLSARNEEAVWEAIARWRGAEGGQPGQVRGRGLVGKIRFPLMEEGYLRSRVVGMAPAEDAEWMEGVVAEALRAKAARGAGDGFAFELLGPKALDDRAGRGVKWGQYADGGGRRLKGHTDRVVAVAECEGRACSGSWDGSIRVWSAPGGAAPALERRIAPERADDAVLSLSAWEGRLISGHRSGRLRVWSAATGACHQVLEGHSLPVHALAVCGSRLASGSADGPVKVWALGAAAPWACERALRSRAGGATWSLAGWRGKVLGGAWDGDILVWDAGTGARDGALAGHTGAVHGLAVRGDRLFSASSDGTIRAWALGGAWAALRTVEACGPGQCPRCLAVSGAQLVSGSEADDGGREVRVWDVDTLDRQHTLPQPPGADVWALLAVEGAVWAGVGRDVVVWGRGA
jgi:hypothetical protein